VTVYYDNLTLRLIAEEQIIAPYQDNPRNDKNAFHASGKYLKYTQMYRNILIGNYLYNHDIQISSCRLDIKTNKYETTNKEVENRGGGDYTGTRGHYRGVRDRRVLNKREPYSGVNLNAATKAWECLWCQLDTHKTIDSRKMKRAQMAGDQSNKPEALSSSFFAADEKMLIDPKSKDEFSGWIKINL
jgi:hypothetical protein